MCHVGHQDDIILHFGSQKFFLCKSDMWNQHDIFMPRKKNTIGGFVLTKLLVLHP
jgi:hypothetical protein